MHYPLRYSLRYRIAPALALALSLPLSGAHAQVLQSSGPPPSVVITGNPLGSALFDLVTPVSTIEGAELQVRSQGSLGETLRHLPGVSATQFGPAASRPVIRGLDGDRVRILQGSVGTLDASALSVDHAVPVDTLAVDRIEVVRGPAALFYGGSAVGGVVNLLTNRIPEKAIAAPQGALDTRAGGAEGERGAAALLETGNGRFALHADGFWRQSSDVVIPGFARSSRQRALDAANDRANGTSTDQPSWRVPNSAARADGGAVGGAFTWDQGYAGLSWTNHSINYGSPAERNVRIDMHSDRIDARAEVRELSGFIRSLKFKAARTDYVHREVNSGIVGTNFFNQGHEARVEAAHAPVRLASLLRALPGTVTGAFGVQTGKSRFSALGEEAFIPVTQTQSSAAYLFEELALGAGTLQFGLRGERTLVNAAADATLIDASTGRPRFGAERARRFDAGSFSAGLSQAVPLASGTLNLSVNLSHTERAPTYAELFANGPHAATGAYEIGNATFGVEQSNALEAGVKWRGGAHSAGLSVYQTRFDNFITGFATGIRRDANGTINAAGVFREFAFRQTPARLAGFEAEARLRLLERPGTLHLELKADAVRADQLTSAEPLPRIPAARFGAALNYARAAWNVKLEVTHTLAQTRVPAGDLPSDANTMVNVYANTRLSSGRLRWSAWLKAANLGNVEARVATSLLRDIVPLGGRALAAGVRMDF